MNITGIIAEYNPFHLGHKHHLNMARKDTNCQGIICIMSGNFMQRGMPSIIDKFTRAKMAVLNGVDLVIELPLVYSISSAEGFAEGAVKILNETNVVNNLYFGSEHGNTEDLSLIASALLYESNEYKIILKENLSKGLPFHLARKNALLHVLPNVNCNEILANSNNILAIEYIKALKKYNSSIVPYTLKRAGANYNETELISNFPSATSIRKILETHNNLTLLENALPKETLTVLNDLANNNYSFVFSESMFSYLKYKILTKESLLCNLAEVSEGLNHKLIKEIINSKNLDDFILKVKSKRYTYTRISRILTSLFIGLEDYDINNIISTSSNYIRPLAFNSTGIKILKEIKLQGNIEIVNKIPKKITNPMLNLDILGTKAYSILNSSISPYEDYVKSPYYLK